MKNILLGITVMLCSFSYAQKEELLFEVEYEMNGRTLKSFAFSTENCKKDLIHKSWSNWVSSKGGSSGFLKKNEASNVHFKGSQDTYKSTISLVDEENSKITIINTLTDQNGMIFNQNSMEFEDIYRSLEDLAIQTKLSCVRTEMKSSNEYMIRLTKENADAQAKKGTSIKSYLKNSNSLLKLESKRQNIADKLDLLTNRLEGESNDKTITSLMVKKEKTENSLKNIESDISLLSNKLQVLEENDRELDSKLKTLSTQIQQQRALIDNLKKKYSSISR